MLCDYRCVACLWEGMNSFCTVRLKDFRGRGRCEGQVRQERQINLHLTAANQLLPVYCHPGFSSYGDGTSLTFATSRTGAHPGSSAIIVPVPHHMTRCSSSDTFDSLPLLSPLQQAALILLLPPIGIILNCNFTGRLKKSKEESHTSWLQHSPIVILQSLSSVHKFQK